MKMDKKGDGDMGQDGGLWAHHPDFQNSELKNALGMLDESQYLLGLIMMGVALQYKSLDLERQKLLGGDVQLPPRNMQAAASLVTLCALFGFQAQALSLNEPIDVRLGANSILIAILRLFRLIGRSNDSTKGSDNAVDNEIIQSEELDEPVI